MSLFSRLLRLFSRKRPVPPQPPPIDTAAVPPPADVAVVEAPAAPDPEPPVLTVEPPAPPPPLPEATPPAPLAAPEPEPEPDVAIEDEEGEEPADAEEDFDDPLSGSGEPLQISLPTAETVAAGRREAEQLAMSGPQKVTLTDPAGPGSLAETLARLEAEGRLTSEIVDDPETGPYILYHPVS